MVAHRKSGVLSHCVPVRYSVRSSQAAMPRGEKKVRRGLPHRQEDSHKENDPRTRCASTRRNGRGLPRSESQLISRDKNTQVTKKNKTGEDSHEKMTEKQRVILRVWYKAEAIATFSSS
jgi:hypothetical protein